MKILALLGLAITILFQNCSGDTITGNPVRGLDIRFQSYSITGLVSKLLKDVPTGTEVANTSNAESQKTILASAFAIDVCVEFIAFKYYYSRSPDIYDPARVTQVDRVGEFSILTTGTSLGSHDFADGEYNQIEISFAEKFDWSPCGYRVRVTNSNGVFYARTGIFLIYQGAYTINNDLHVLELPSQDFADAMMEVNADAEACLIDASRADCIACTADPLGPNCKTIERLVEERGLGDAY